MLSERDLEAYERDGQLTPEIRLPGDFMANINTKMESLFAERPELGTDYVPHLIEIDRSWLKFAKHPTILDVVSRIIGQDIIVWGSALFCKAAIGGKATPWHQDGQYWPIRPLATVTVWIAIDPATPENGCLRVVPGSHEDRKLYEHEVNDSDAVVLNQELDISRLKHSTPRDVVLDPGMFSIHDVYMVHGAEPNNSGKRRGGIVFRYMPATSHYDRDLAARQVRELSVLDISQRELHLVQGIDACGKNDLYKGAV